MSSTAWDLITLTRPPSPIPTLCHDDPQISQAPFSILVLRSASHLTQRDRQQHQYRHLGNVPYRAYSRYQFNTKHLLRCWCCGWVVVALGVGGCWIRTKNVRKISYLFDISYASFSRIRIAFAHQIKLHMSHSIQKTRRWWRREQKTSHWA